MDAPQPVGSIRGAIESSVFDWLKCSNILMGGHQEMMTRAGVGMNEADLSFVRSWAAISMDEIVRPGQTLEQFHHMSYQACASSWPLDGLGARDPRDDRVVVVVAPEVLAIAHSIVR